MHSRLVTGGAWAVALLLATGAVACDGCRGKSPAAAPGAAGAAGSGAPPSGASAGFAGQSARLASLPPGHELGETSFSPDGRHVAFVATRDGKAFVFLDAKASGAYEDARGLAFPEGRSGLAFVARQGGKELVVVDGVEGARYGGVGTARFAPDGRVVYSAQQDGAWQVVVGARATAAPGASDPSPFVSADGKRVVFTEQDAVTGKARLRACSLELTGCSEGGAYDAISPSHTGPSGPLLAFVAARGGKEAVATVRLDGPGLAEQTSGWYDAVPLFAASSGGEHLAFLASRGDLQLLVRDGAELPVARVDSPLELAVSRSGRVLLTGVVDNKVAAFVEGKRVGRDQAGLYFPLFSPDGASHAYVAEWGEKNALVVNGEEGPLFDKVVTPRFTPDGARVVYRARQNGERFAVVADAHARTVREHPHYEAVFDVIVSPDGKSVGYGVRTGQELWWKVEKL